MSTIEPQEPWASAMIAVGAVDPRREGVASWNRLGEIADVHTSTITGFIAGERTPSTKTIRKIATALRLPTEVVSGWIRDTRPVRSVYQPPAEADMLTDRQRKALTELIRSMVTDEQRAGEGRADRPAPMSDAGGTPANVRPFRPAPKSSRVPSSKAARGGNDDRPKPVGDGGA